MNISFLNLETCLAFKKFINNFSFLDSGLYDYNVDLKKNYLFEKDINSLNKIELLLLIGCNIRIEAPFIYLCIKRNNLNNVFLISMFKNLLLLFSKDLGGFSILDKILKGKAYFCKLLLNLFDKFFCFFGTIFLLSKKIRMLMNIFNFLLLKIKNIDFIFSLLQAEGGFTNILDLGLISNINYRQDKVMRCSLGYFVGDFEKDENIFFSIYQGSQGDFFSFKVNVVLPSCHYVESENLYVNMSGIVKETKVVVKAPNFSRPD